MKVLLFAALYPPHVVGGAEISAWNLAEWLVEQGWTVGVVRAAARGEEEGEEKPRDGLTIWRVRTPHIYPVTEFQTAPSWMKPIWHLQDHFDPRIQGKIGRILDRFKPDLVNIHILQGLGYRALRETARRNIPVNYVLPDLGLACVRMSMFKAGKDCPRQCGVCRLSARYKQSLLADQARISFLSPSRANLATLARIFRPVKEHRSASILNPNAYPKPQGNRTESDRLRLLFAGRLHPSKGVSMLVDAVADLAKTHQIELKIAGRGPLEEELRARAATTGWCRVLGFISHAELAEEMVNSDLLCIPSVWAENSPGVVIQALGVGLPVMGSDRGGIPELVEDEVNGRLVRGASMEAWKHALQQVLDEPQMLRDWRRNAELSAPHFEQARIGSQIMAWMEMTANGSAS